MNGDSWDAVSTQIKKKIFEERSILSQFPPEAASITAREIVLSLTADCSCRKTVGTGAPASIETAPVTAPSQQKRALGRHGINANETKAAVMVRSTVETDARCKRFSVKLDTDADLQWVMQAVNYGLTMSAEHWDIVVHSVHLCCEWLCCLLPAQGQRGAHLPHALLANPVTYAHRLLCALCRFFAPHAPADLPTDGLFTFLHQAPRDPPDPVFTAASSTTNGTVEEIVRGLTGAAQPNAVTVAGEGERWLQERYIPLVSRIVSRVEQILYTSHLLTGPLWDHLLDFCLAVCYAVLAPPPQIDSSFITLSRPFSQSPGVRGMLQLECLVAGMLNRVWLRALSQHYPSPAYWQGLQELCHVSRHRVGLSYIWSRMLVVFTCNVLRPHLAPELSCSSGTSADRSNILTTTINPPPLSAFQTLLNRQLNLDIPEEIAEITWFRILHLLDNPVDLCHPAEITRTILFEYFRRSNAAVRCRLTAAFLPAIFHHLMHSLSTVVDLFLGIAPSPAGCLSTFVGVPQNLYGPLADVAEYFQYASVRSPDTIFLGKPRGANDHTDNFLPDNEAQTAVAVSKGSFASLTLNSGLSSSLLNPQSVAEAWLQPDILVTYFYNRPHIDSLLRLLGPWLFEAAIGRYKGTSTSGKESAIISERSLKVDNVSFQVGRAEAMACLCRIFIYARKSDVSLDHLTRFYICLLRALTIDPEVEYVLSTVLFYIPDLLRADLVASFSLLVPTIFNAVQWVLRRPSVVCPEYISMVLLRRASLHQLLSMVCMPNQFNGVPFQELSTPTQDSSALSARVLRTKLAGLLCDLLTYETDTLNLRMLLSAAYTLVLDMIAFELPGLESKSKSSTPHSVDAPTGVESASGLYGLLLEKICPALRRWMNDFVVCSFALDILSGLACVPVPQPSMARCSRCIQSICAFIEVQCRREKKDHTRSLHSLIINAFHCLGVWLVAHPNALNDLETLRAVITTIKLGIFGAGDAPSSASDSQAIGGSRDSLSLPSGMPFSKRVNEAAEHLLLTLFSTAGSFPQAGRPETSSCRLTEERVAQLSKSPLYTFQHFIATSPSSSVSTGAELLLSISEAAGSPVKSGSGAKNKSETTLQRSLTETPPVFTFFRDASGRHLWSWKLRYQPKTSEQGATGVATSAATLRPKNKKEYKSYLDNSWPIKRLSGADDPFMPKTEGSIPLVRAEKEMPTLAQSVFGNAARREVDALKSLIATEAERTAALSRRIREARIRAFNSSAAEDHCQPERRIDQLPSSHLLTCHLGYVPVNSLHASNNSFRLPTGKEAVIDGNSGSNQSQAGTSCVGTRGSRLPPEMRIPGSRGVGGNVNIASLIPSCLTPVDPALVRQLDTELLGVQRSTATVFVFCVKQRQTTLEMVINNMNAWPETPKSFQSFVRSLGWQVNATQHPSWSGPLRRSLYSPSSGEDGSWLGAPDGVENFFYWADASTEVVTLCPSKRTKINKKPSGSVTSTEDFRAAVLWLESWDDALWIPGWDSEGKGSSCGGVMPAATSPMTSNPLQVAITTEFVCSLVVLIHPLGSNGLFRIGLIRPCDLGHEAGPLTTGLLLSAPLLGSMVRSTLVNILHRLAADSGDPATAAARKRLAAFAASATTGRSVERGRTLSSVELLAWSSERCH